MRLRQLPPVGTVLEHELLESCVSGQGRGGRAAGGSATRSAEADAPPSRRGRPSRSILPVLAHGGRDNC